MTSCMRGSPDMDALDIQLPLTDETVESLHAGMAVRLSGTCYTARDAAHKRLIGLLDRSEPLPIPLQGQTIYYVGPSPTPPGRAIGAAGPTTSYRMDAYTPRLLSLGLKGMIGKGKRSQEVIDAIRREHAVYFGAVGGAAALLSHHITACELIAFPDLQSEAIRRLTLDRFPAVVLIDSRGVCFPC